MNFWQGIPKPFFALAPMDEVTDVVFRNVVAKIGKPDVFFTEFTNVDGLCSAGREKLLPRLKIGKSDHPIVAQIWGKNPGNFYSVSKELVKMGFDGIDINMGCPEKGICKNGCCSALIENQQLAKQIIVATKKGAGKLPVSVKTRIGFKSIQTNEWIGFLLNQNLAALTIHGRTAREMSKGSAHWDEIKKAVKLRDELNSKTLIIGNGDVVDRKDGLEKVRETGVDGIMIGRGIFKNLWCFKKTLPKMTQKQMLKLLVNHAKLFDKTWGESKNFQILRKFFKIYVSDFRASHKLRMKLMEVNNFKELERIIKPYV